MSRAYALLAVLAMLAGAYAYGRHDGRTALQARLDAAQVMADRSAAEATRALDAAEQQRRVLAQSLEDLANADPVAVPACLSADRVRRLNAR